MYVKSESEELQIALRRALNGEKLVSISVSFFTSPIYLENKIMKMIAQYSEDSQNVIINKLIDFASNDQFHDLYIAKKIILNDYDRQTAMKAFGLSKISYNRIIRYVPIISEKVGVEKQRLDSIIDAYAPKVGTHFRMKRRVVCLK